LSSIPLVSLQIVAPLAGRVSVDLVALECPPGLSPTDCSGEQFGGVPNSSPCPYCPGAVFTTSLNMSCLEPCPCGSYRVTDHRQCQLCEACPIGGNCFSGLLLAVAGHWGAADAAGTVEFSACPADYCCDGSVEWPCSAPNSCAGNRTGALCGDCAPGTVESVGSEHCVAVDRCAGDVPLVWPAFVAIVLVAAGVQLTTVSGVWRPSSAPPSGKAKLLIFYAQVGASAGAEMPV
jgi:hypothetical protein